MASPVRRSVIMKIIDNPALGIGFLLCVGLAVLGFSLLPTAEGQQHSHHYNLMVSTDEQAEANWQIARPHVSSMVTTDEYSEPYVVAQNPGRSRTAAVPPRQRSLERSAGTDRPNSVRIERAQISGTISVPASNNDPFAQAAQPQSSSGVRHLDHARWVTTNSPETRPLPPAEKRDELLHRIVQLRLNRGEFEKLPPVVSQMHKPETAIETILDFAEKSVSDDENIEQLLDMVTMLTLQIGQPKAAISIQHVFPHSGGQHHIGVPYGGNVSGLPPAYAPMFSEQNGANSVTFAQTVPSDAMPLPSAFAQQPLPSGTVPGYAVQQQSQTLNADVIAGPVAPQIVTVIEGTVATESVSQEQPTEPEPEQPADQAVEQPAE